MPVTKKISDYHRISASVNAGIVGERLCGNIVPFLCLPKEKEPSSKAAKERAPQQHWPAGPQFLPLKKGNFKNSLRSNTYTARA
jgi:hypothetical protein